MKEPLQQEARRALGAALRYLTARDHTRHEVKCFLWKKGFSDQAVGHTLEKLGEWGYLDDRKVALNWARTKMEVALWGRARVIAGLERRGLEPQTIGELLCLIQQELSDKDLALRAARKYIRTHPRAKAALGRRLAAYLSRRGFGLETVKEVLKEELGPDWRGEGLAR